MGISPRGMRRRFTTPAQVDLRRSQHFEPLSQGSLYQRTGLRYDARNEMTGPGTDIISTSEFGNSAGITVIAL
jgi:hypothetical protein